MDPNYAAFQVLEAMHNGNRLDANPEWLSEHTGLNYSDLNIAATILEASMCAKVLRGGDYDVSKTYRFGGVYLLPAAEVERLRLRKTVADGGQTIAENVRCLSAIRIFISHSGVDEVLAESVVNLIRQATMVEPEAIR